MGPDNEAQTHRVNCGEHDCNYKPGKSVQIECGAVSITYFHTKVFTVHWTTYINRNKDIHQEMHNPAERTAETNAFWEFHSELRPP